MKTVTTIKEVRDAVKAWRRAGETVGWYPLWDSYMKVMHRLLKKR